MASKIVNTRLVHFTYDVTRLLAHSRSYLANKKARNATVGAENLLICISGTIFLPMVTLRQPLENKNRL